MPRGRSQAADEAPEKVRSSGRATSPAPTQKSAAAPVALQCRMYALWCRRRGAGTPVLEACRDGAASAQRRDAHASQLQRWSPLSVTTFGAFDLQYTQSTTHSAQPKSHHASQMQAHHINAPDSLPEVDAWLSRPAAFSARRIELNSAQVRHHENHQPRERCLRPCVPI